jgi:ankyrin repeat protein
MVIPGRTEIVRILLEYGADFNLTSNNGETPLMWACRRNNIDIVRLLLKLWCGYNY